MCAVPAQAQVYLNDTNISVALGASMAPEPFENRTTAASLASIIDAPTAAAPENHTQSTHVWVSGGALEIDFDFGAEYDLQTLHFWNYFAEGFDVDNFDFLFYDANRQPVGSLLGVMPALGGSGGNPIFAEHIALAFPGRVRFVNAVLTGSNGEVDFNNIGFTARCSAASWSNFGAGWPGTTGVPGLALDIAPVFGTRINLQIGSSSTIAAASCLIVGSRQVATPTAFGGTLLVDVVGEYPLVVPPAGLNLSGRVPNDPSLCGTGYLFQLVQCDPGASAGVSFSRGLRLTVGN